VNEMLRRRSGEVHLYGELLWGLQMRQGRGWSELSMTTAQKGRKTGEEAALTGGRRLAGCGVGKRYGEPFYIRAHGAMEGQLGVGVARQECQ
jgi:hypothetical protein